MIINTVTKLKHIYITICNSSVHSIACPSAGHMAHGKQTTSSRRHDNRNGYLTKVKTKSAQIVAEETHKTHEIRGEWKSVLCRIVLSLSFDSHKTRFISEWASDCRISGTLTVSRQFYNNHLRASPHFTDHFRGLLLGLVSHYKIYAKWNLPAILSRHIHLRPLLVVSAPKRRF